MYSKFVFDFCNILSGIKLQRILDVTLNFKFKTVQLKKLKTILILILNYAKTKYFCKVWTISTCVNIDRILSDLSYENVYWQIDKLDKFSNIYPSVDYTNNK